ncbi:MAG: protein kinase [Caldilineaceae bacterium]|nr:protein kinase [Caldilineaceae bacterium]
MSRFDRRGMDESSKEVAAEELSEREAGTSLPIEEAQQREGAGAHARTPELSARLTGTTMGHYLVGERLGGGAMATVYRAYDQVLERDVAIKVLLPGADGVMQARFRQEARAVSLLEHPHIVRTIEVGRSGGIIYIAMELVEGSSLGELLDRYGKLSVGDAARILAPIAQALAFAHDHGFIHRDVKPSNILLKRANPGAANSVMTELLPYPVIPLLSDFGIARALDAPELTNAGRTIGTPAFMAPEQCAGSSEIDGRADVYALGAVLYRCLVGRAPFAGSTTQILHAHVYDPLLIPDSVADALPLQAVRIMARAMMKEPAQRYASVELMAAELQAVADLPSTPPVDPSAEVADPTMTMASLPVTQTPTSVTSRVLVPAASVGSSRPALKPVPRVVAPTTTPPRAIPVAPPPNARRTRSRRERWGMMTLGAILVVLMFALGAMVASNWLPGRGEATPESANVTPTAAAVAVDGTVQVPAVGLEGSEGDETPVANGEPTARPTAAGPTATPTPKPPPAVELEFAWDNAQAFYDETDWALAREWLNIVRTKMELEDSPFEAQIDAALVDEMLIRSYLGLVTNASTQGKWAEAIDLLDKALEIAPDDLTLLDIRSSIEGLAKLEDSNEATAEEMRKELREALAAIFSGYGERLVKDDGVCSAVIQIENAQKIFDSESLQDRQAELTQLCATEEAVAGLVETGGSILYSSVDESSGRYHIFRLPITLSNLTAMQSTLIVNNGAQPRLSPNGTMLAFNSRAPNAEGLYGFVLGSSADDRAIRYSGAPEDSRDGPPSWNWRGTLLAYGASYGGQASHVYVTSADDNRSSTDLGDGKDPAWHPSRDLIVFNGTDGGRDPGLFLMSSDGTGRTRLTINGNDQRPTWTPDGQYIVFMSKDRNNVSDWEEIYRYTLQTGEIVPLTDHPSKNGLPSVSPDGKWVAFMSDRGGRWRLWYVSIDGGETRLLSEISGQPVAWLEHAIQWVP